jgi:glycosyltransferase involved in cell wall biosynthesis
MKILHVVSTIAKNSGGPTRVLVDMTRAQIKIGYDVTVIASDRDNPATQLVDREAIKSLFEDNVEMFLFPVNFHQLLISSSMLRWLQKNIEKFDLVHIHGSYRFPPTIAGIVARWHRVPFVIRPHGNLDPFLLKRSSKSVALKRVYEKLFDFPNFRAASAIHYTAEDEYNRAASLNFKGPHFIVPNGLNWDEYETLPSPGAFRARLRIGPEVPLVLFLGRLNFKKGLDLLIPAFAQVVQRIPDAKLAIVGPDTEGYGATVRQMVLQDGLNGNVYFVDALTGKSVREAYVDADLFVLPSYTENFGMTVIEALACATPVVISDQVNIYPEVEKSRGGIIVPCDRARLASALNELLQQPGKLKEMGASGRPWAEAHYAWSSVVRRLDQEYRTIIELHGRTPATTVP